MAKKKQSKKADSDIRTMRFIVIGERVVRHRGFVLPTGQFVAMARQKPVGWDPPKSQHARVFEPGVVYASEELAKEAAGMVNGFAVRRGAIEECMLRPRADGTLECDGYYGLAGFRTRKEAAAAANKELDELKAELSKDLAAIGAKRRALRGT